MQQDAILVVDDNKNNLDLMLVTLSEKNYRLLAATSGERALKIASKVVPDLILMDIQMPGMDGYETTRKIKATPELEHIPVLFLSALNDLDNVVRCFEAGGVDYISKPFRKEELLARVDTHLSLKHLRSQISDDRDKISYILHNILPSYIVDQLKAGQKPEPQRVEDAVVLFTDFSGFTKLTKKLGAVCSINNLNTIFSSFDEIASHFGLERLKTIGDSYMAVGNVNNSLEHPIEMGVMAGLKMQEYLERFNAEHGDDNWQVRIGVHVGDVMAGIVGYQRLAFDVWGDTVNLASRLEANANTEGVTITDPTKDEIAAVFQIDALGQRELHNLGPMELYQCNALNGSISEEVKQRYEALSVDQLLEESADETNMLERIAEFT